MMFSNDFFTLFLFHKVCLTIVAAAAIMITHIQGSNDGYKKREKKKENELCK